MKFLAKVTLGSLAGVLIISAIAVMTPRAVYAVIATIIRDQDNPARHPFATFCGLTPANANDSVSECNSPAIPAGQEVVIETISIEGFSDTTNTVLAPTVHTSAGGTILPYDLNPLADAGLGQPNFSTYRGVFSSRLYADPTTTIGCHVETKNLNPAVRLTGFCFFSGYFVTLP